MGSAVEGDVSRKVEVRCCSYERGLKRREGAAAEFSGGHATDGGAQAESGKCEWHSDHADVEIAVLFHALGRAGFQDCAAGNWGQAAVKGTRAQKMERWEMVVELME